MRRGRVFILLALILIVGAVGLFFVVGGLGPGTQAEATPLPTPIGDAEIVIAAQNIARGSVIPQEAVIVSPYPADYLVETMMVDPILVIGRRARMDIARGVPITQNMITEEAGDLLGVGSDAAIAIPPGFTALSLPMNRLSGVAYAIRGGDQVDVLVSLLMIDLDVEFQTELPNQSIYLFDSNNNLLTAYACTNIVFQEGIAACAGAEIPPPAGHIETDEDTGQQLFVAPSGSPRPRLVTQRLIVNATVLHVGEFPLAEEEEMPVVAPAEPEQQPQAGEAAPVEEPAVVPPDIITLIVQPQDALALNWAMKAGLDITLSLRSPNDPSLEDDTDSVTLQYLIDNYDIAIPLRLPYGTEPRLEAMPRAFPPEQPIDEEEGQP